MLKCRYFAICVAILMFLVTPCLAQQPWCGTQTLYFQHQYSPEFPTTYEELQNYPSGNTEEIENVTVINTGGPVLIDTYIMPTGAITTQSKLLRGLRTFTTWHYVSLASGTTQINFTAFQRFVNGTEVVFYSQLSDDIDALTVTDYTTYRVSTQDLMLYPGDRLGIKVYAQTTHSSPVKVYFAYQGTTHASHFESGFFDCEEAASIGNPKPIPISAIVPIISIVVVILFLRRKQ